MGRMSRPQDGTARDRSRGRVLVVDCAPGTTALTELADLSALGLEPAVNVRRVAEPELRSRIAARWRTVDFDGFAEEELARQLEDGGLGYEALKCRVGIPLTEAVLERATSHSLQHRLVLVARAAAGSDTFDAAAARRRCPHDPRSQRRDRRRTDPGAHARCPARRVAAGAGSA